jgi:hypothetical protein
MLSFYREGDGGRIEHVFPLFPRKGLNGLFPSIEGKAEHYCAFALPEHGSITFHCNLEASLNKHRVSNYDEFVAMLDTNTLRVKAYYPLLHLLRGLGSDFSNVFMVKSDVIRKVFDSFLFMSERFNWWGERGVLSVPEDEEQHVDRIDASMFRKEISCLRIEASFILNVPNKGLDATEVLTSMEGLLGKHLNLFFGRGVKEEFFTWFVILLLVKYWKIQIKKDRKTLTRQGG